MRYATVLGLAGGFGYGVAQGGGQCVGMWENGFGQRLAMANLPGTPYLDEGRSNPPGNLDLIVGCPPCAGWSSASAGLDRRFNPEHSINDGIRRWFEGVEVARPSLAVLECVPNLAINGSGLWGPLVRRLEEVGFSWSIVIYDNQWLGVPQRRERMLFWAYRGHGELEFPVWWEGRPSHPIGRALAERTDDWWQWHQPLDGRPVHELFRYMEPGGNVRKVPLEAYLEHYHQPGVRDGWPSFTYRRLHEQRPAPAMMANALQTIVHYEEPARLITGRELARIMGYPDEFILDWEGRRGTKTEMNRLSAWLTQAVSPAVGRWAALTAETYLEQGGDNRRFDGQIVDLRTGSTRVFA